MLESPHNVGSPQCWKDLIMLERPHNVGDKAFGGSQRSLKIVFYLLFCFEIIC